MKAIEGEGMPLEILLVEDNPGDVRLTQEAFRDANKRDDSLKTIPTVILTTSEAEADILKSYQLQANCYLSKPVQLDAFENLVKSINDFWLVNAKLPPQRQRA